MRPLFLAALFFLAGCKKCLEYEKRAATCGGGCSVWMIYTNADGTTFPMCVTWADPYPCTQDVCVRREP